MQWQPFNADFLKTVLITHMSRECGCWINPSSWFLYLLVPDVNFILNRHVLIPLEEDSGCWFCVVWQSSHSVSSVSMQQHWVLKCLWKKIIFSLYPTIMEEEETIPTVTCVSTIMWNNRGKILMSMLLEWRMTLPVGHDHSATREEVCCTVVASYLCGIAGCIVDNILDNQYFSDECLCSAPNWPDNKELFKLSAKCGESSQWFCLYPRLTLRLSSPGSPTATNSQQTKPWLIYYL